MAEGRLNGKNAIITGGGSGFGRATAHRFVKEGAAHVFLVDRRSDRLETVQKEIKELGGHASAIQAELSLAEDCARVIETAKRADGRIDILVSNAAAWTSEPFLEMKKESWDRVLAVNLTAAFLLGQGAARVMKDQGRGVILYTASISSLGASKDFTHYGVTKAGIVNLVQNMAIELAPYNIRVNCISPGPSDTQQSTDIVGAETMEKFRKDFPVVPLGRRLGRPEEMAAAFAFLASDDASYITGHNLVIDGGLTAHAYSIPEPA
jgi:NAD(P)-dependent dehydrogenase (short-subunit alcohol dehydrogenase family)